MCWRYEASQAFCSTPSCILYVCVLQYALFYFERDRHKKQVGLGGDLLVSPTAPKLALLFLTQDARGEGVRIFCCLWWRARIKKLTMIVR